MKAISTCFFLVILNSVCGQNYHQYAEKHKSGENEHTGIVNGKISDTQSGQAVEYATIALYITEDSTLVTGTISDAEGKFKMEANYGHYYAVIEFISYGPKMISGIELTGENPEANIGSVNISPSSRTLEEVEVTAEKGQVQIGLDKKVFNVEKDLSNIGGTAQDVLQNVPSVQLDMDGNVSLRGSSNVRILIDGKPSGLTGISSKDALEQIPANNIESIEVITNPSVKYDP